MSAHLKKVRLSALVLCMLCHIAMMIRPSLGQNMAQPGCETTDVNGTKVYRTCLPQSEALYDMSVIATVEPVNSTCGYETSEADRVFCSLDVFGPCNFCDATNQDLSHPPRYSYDKESVTGQPATWWQSITWNTVYPAPLEINLTLSFNHSYTLDNDIQIFFQPARPRRMILEKSSDYGQTWEPYQFYADNCNASFQMANVDTVRTPIEVICTQKYSTGIERYPQSLVLFDYQNRLTLLGNSEEGIRVALENNTELRAFLEVTDLRLRLLYPATDGTEWQARRNRLIRFYYAISNIEAFFICNCNLHGKYCYQNNSETICQCFHNTMGKSCEQCLPLYNNRPWQRGSSIPGGPANECQKCECNEHSDSCTYNASLGRGMCNNCRDNTDGASCEICTDGYYRNTSVLASSPNSCIECSCEPRGTVENTTACAQYPVNGQPLGQCSCRSNIEGRACDQCVDQSYGLLLNDGLGCRDCNCNLLGTVNASNVCDKQAGDCPCKSNIDTRTCGECKDGYYGYPTTENEVCTPCDCNLGGSTSPICNKVSGRCACRSNITDRQCSITDQGFYFAYLDSNSYDAWEADSTCLQTSTVPHNLFTGRGFQTCYQGYRVTFNGVTAVTSLADALFYRPAIRYTYRSASPWQQATLGIVVSQSGAGSSSCPVAANTPISTLTLAFPPGTATAWYAPEGQAVMLDRRCQYQFTLTLVNRGNGSQEIEIDSLVIVPSFGSSAVYTQADANTKAFYAACAANMTALETRTYAIDQCQQFMSAVSAESNNGALECMCNPTGSMGTLCSGYGGSCECKIGVGGPRCDRCLPGFYGFSAEGCKPCSCDPVGSRSLACDFATGQCPCKSGVALDGQLTDAGSNSSRQCSRCLANYYGFSTGGGCMACDCNVNGSLTLQCTDTGDCLCKDTIAGRQCNNCIPGYFLFSADGCTSCNCNPAGSTSTTCHPSEGTCPCKPNAQGAKCGQCRSGFFNLQPANPSGCQPCFCYGHGSQCNTAPNYTASSIVADFTSGNVPISWTATEPTALAVSSAGLRVTQPPSLPAQSYVYLLAPRRYLGEHLDLYGRRLSYTMKLDTGTVDNTTQQYLILSGGRTNLMIYYSKEVFIPTLTQTQFEATFYEANWKVVGEERAPTVTELQGILSNITGLQIRATFGPGTASTFVNFAMETVQMVTTSAEGTVFVTAVEQCVCSPTSNTMGLSCDQCNPGTYRQAGMDTSFDVCVPCQCNGRASTCDSITGMCQGCQLGTQGNQCEACAANVMEPSCDRCVADHYGFGTQLFNGACSPCNCNVTGTGGATQCDMQTGQCPCTGNYGGRLCDSCQFNFYNYQQGCLACDMCYSSVSTEHSDLQARSSNVSDFVTTLTAADRSDTLGPFYDRLTTTYSQMLEMVQRTNAVITEGNALTSTVTSLNTTMHQLLASLSGAIKTGTETAGSNLATIEGLVGQARTAITATEQALVQSHAGLTKGDIQSAQVTLNELKDNLTSTQAQLDNLASLVSAQEATLAQKVQDISGIAQTTVQTAELAIMTAQQAQSIHDNTTTNTANLVTKANQVTTQGQQTEQAVSEVMQRAQQARQAGEEGSEAALTARIEELDGSVNTVIATSTTKSEEAARLEAQVAEQQASSNQVLNDLATTQSLTDSLLVAVNGTLSDVNARYDRAVQANQTASAAVASSEAAFTSAEEMLQIVQNFDSQSTEAQTAANAALQEESAIQTRSSETTAQAVTLRGQLSTATTDAQEGLSVANQAFQSAQAEQQSLQPVSQRASQLASESATKFQGTNQTVESVRTINASQLSPAKAQCDAYSPSLQTLEDRVTQGNREAQSSTDATLATQANIARLLADVANIQQVSTADLPGLVERIRQARVTFTQGDYTQLVTTLTQAIQEQQVWLETTQAGIREMEAQIDALESFRLT